MRDFNKLRAATSLSVGLFLGSASLSDYSEQKVPKSSPKYSITSLIKEIKALRLGWGIKPPEDISGELYGDSIVNGYKVLPNGVQVDVDLSHPPISTFSGTSKSYIEAERSHTTYIDIRMFGSINPPNGADAVPIYRFLFTPVFKKTGYFVPDGFGVFVQYTSNSEGTYSTITTSENGSVTLATNTTAGRTTSNHKIAEHVFVDVQKQALELLDSASAGKNPQPLSPIKLPG